LLMFSFSVYGFKSVLQRVHGNSKDQRNITVHELPSVHELHMCSAE